ncbi:MAG TPA: twin-arginine translocation signal domain-containing protein [Acidobacteriaceae bacterium]|nr:twin-arginine translocation signal domain-containing protein [Acidobacteriaceae bacterium]
MRRRDFLKGSALAAAAGLGAGRAQGYVPAHNWGNYDFGSGPVVNDRLNQGPFPQYPPDAVIPSDDVVMTTTPSDEPVPNYGKGLITYITADMGTDEIRSDNVLKTIEELVAFPLGQLLYLRPTWREVQPRPGRLELPEHFKFALDLGRRHNKRIGFRIQMSAPDYRNAPALPDFVLDRVPKVDLILSTSDSGDRAAAQRYLTNPYARYQPRFDDPFFQQAFEELVGLLAAEFNGNPGIEFMDTFLYGFWGEGHTWPFSNNPFPDYQTAERTWVRMLEMQLEHFTKTPLLTNTQPDFSHVGNSEVLDRSVRSNNWIRSDTIFIENEQIEALSNRPPWIGALLEQGLSGRAPDPAEKDEGISPAENMISHVMDVGANYWSLWNFHQINPATLEAFYRASPQWFDQINRRIGYRVRPAFIWSYEADGYAGIIAGFANDGIAGVPGVLRVSVVDENGQVLKSGCLDAGYPLPGKIRQAQFVLPKGTKWRGLRMKAEIEVKGMRYPVRLACHQKLNEDGSLTLRPNLRQHV